MKMRTTLAALLALTLIPSAFAQVSEAAKQGVTQAVNATNPKKAKAAPKEKIDFNGPLSVGDDLSASQIANPLLRNRMEQSCTLVSGQEINASIDVGGGGEAGIYLLEATCGQKTKQYLYIAKPTQGEELNEILFAELKSTTNKTIYYQENTRRIFFSSDNSKSLREMRWQELARKAMSKASVKNNAAVFSKAVPKGPLPILP